MKELTIYEILHKPTGKVRLVRAANAARARSHVTVDTHAVSVPTPNRLVALVEAGVKVENAGEYPVPAAHPMPPLTTGGQFDSTKMVPPESLSGLVTPDRTFATPMPAHPAVVGDMNDGSEID